MGDDASTTASQQQQTTAPGSPDQHSFPLDIDVIDHWVKFSSFKYSRENRQADAINDGYTGIITLPVPHDLQTGYKTDYVGEELGIPGLISSEFFGKAAEIVKATKKAQGNVVRGALGSISDAQGDLGQGVAKTFIDSLTLNTPGALSGLALDQFRGGQLATGLRRNPHLAVLFQGIGLRSHSFAYRFQPRNEEESDSLRDIIRYFKTRMAPDFQPDSGSHLFMYPEEWEISFQDENYLFDIGPSVLTSFNVNYHGHGVPSYFQSTNAPTAVSISLNFMETHINTRQTIETHNR